MRLLLPLFLATLVVGCSTETLPENAQVDGPKDSAPATDAAINDSDDSQASKVFVIDVRSKEEWDTGHVEQAVNIPHTEISERIGEVTDDKNATIVLYCAVGGRAGVAKKKLEELGFKNVENAGGFDDVKDRFK